MVPLGAPDMSSIRPSKSRPRGGGIKVAVDLPLHAGVGHDVPVVAPRGVPAAPRQVSVFRSLLSLRGKLWQDGCSSESDSGVHPLPEPLSLHALPGI